MALTYTTRLGLIKWGASTDDFTRAQINAAHDALEAKAAYFESGTLAGRPAASASNARGFYLAIDQSPTVLYYSTGSTWVSLNSFATPGAIAPGDSANAGVATTYARSDHRHSVADWGVTGELAQVGTTAAGGSAAKFARVDHAHTLANNSVTAGKIASGAINNSNAFAAGVVNNAALAGSIQRSKLADEALVPTGTVLLYAGSSVPTGFLWCNGASHATSSYSDLFAAIGYTFGGAGANFNVPDFRGLLPRGAATMGGGNTGDTAGTSEVTLAMNNLPNHDHAVGTLELSSNGGHNHSGSTISIANKNIAHTHPVGTLATDGGGAHTHGLNGESNLLDFYVKNTVGSPVGYIGTAATSYPVAVRDAQDVATTSSGSAHDHDIDNSTGQMSDNETHNHTGSVTVASDGTHTHTLSGRTGAIGSGVSFSVINPYLVVGYIIKT